MTGATVIVPTAWRPSDRNKNEMKKKPMYLHETPGGVAPLVNRAFDASFKSDAAYRDSLPDMMEAVNAADGARVPIQQVGCANFRLPLKFKAVNGTVHTLETSVTGTVSLQAGLKGINMGRIMRSFYDHQDEVFTFDVLRRLLTKYQRTIVAFDARIKLSFSYPMVQSSLRSGLSGWQYYRVAYEATMDRTGKFRRVVEFDFVYSSTCPCSAELAEHARNTRGVLRRRTRNDRRRGCASSSRQDARSGSRTCSATAPTRSRPRRK